VYLPGIIYNTEYAYLISEYSDNDRIIYTYFIEKEKSFVLKEHQIRSDVGR